MAIVNIGIPAHIHADRTDLTARRRDAAGVGDASPSNNPIDTSGHLAFIAEVARVLRVLDGAVLVTSAVEGVQPQTRALMRASQRPRPPNLLLVNKNPPNREEYPPPGAWRV